MAKIRNKKTGEIREVPDSQLPNYGINTSSQEGDNSILNTLKGVGDFLTAGGVSASEESVKRQRERAQSGSMDVFNPLSVAKGFGEDVLQPALGPGVMLGLGGLFKGVSPLLTKKGVAGITENLASNATKKGVSVPFSEVANRIEGEVGKQFGKGKEVLDILNKLVNEKRPAGIESVPGSLGINPSDLLDWRKQILNRIGSKNFLQRLLGGSNLEEKVGGTARRTISDIFHETVPQANIPDWIYNKYARFGDVPQNIIRGTGLAAGYGLGKSFLGNLISPFLR